MDWKQNCTVTQCNFFGVMSSFFLGGGRGMLVVDSALFFQIEPYSVVLCD